MSEAGEEQGGTERLMDVSGSKQPELTDEEQNFLMTLYRVLPKLVSGLEMPTGGPSPLQAQEPAPSSDNKEIQDGLDSGGDLEDAKNELFMACWGLIHIIREFRKIEKKIRAIQGGAQLMDALEALSEAARDSICKAHTPDITPMTFLSFQKASVMLLKAFEKLGEGIKDKHLEPLYGIMWFCFGKQSESITKREIPTLCLDLKEHIDNATKGLSEVVESELPEFLKAREKALSIDYNNMLTAATFFSAVTATTLQLSYSYNMSTRASLGVAVNTFWLVALVFSTASSLNSLVGLTWYQKIRWEQLLPDWVKLWIEYGPTISLAVASIAFSAGLSLFAFSSSQHIITSALTATFTTAHAVALFTPMCLYSPNSISRFLLEAFTKSLRPFNYLREVCLRRWYLRKVSRQDRGLVDDFMRYRNWTKANVIAAQCELEKDRARERKSESETVPNAAPSSTGNAIPDPNSRLIGVIKRKIKKAWMFARSVVAWPNTRRPDWLTFRRRKASATQEPNNTEQVHDMDEKVAMRSKLEHDVESQGDTGQPEVQNPIVTGSQSTAPFQGPRTPNLDATAPDQSVDIAARESSEDTDRSFDTHPTLESAKEPVATTSSTTNPIPGLGSRLKVQNSDNDLVDVERQETDAPRRLNQLQEDEPKPPSNCSVRERAEENNVGMSNFASEVGCGHEGIVQEGRPSDQD